MSSGPAASWILHVDLDQFLAAVEVRRRPELRGKPVVVGGSGDPTQRRMVVASASYEARAYGIRAGMPLRAAARRCPEAVFLASDRDTYQAASDQVMAALRSLPVPVEVWGWDEAFLGDVPSPPEDFARTVQRVVAAQTQLSCAVGIGDTRLRAKTATGFAKPGGIYRLTEENWLDQMGARPTEALWGIGRKTARRLADHEVRTVAELAATDPAELATQFGPATGPWLVELGRGGGGTDVSAQPRIARSHSRETTFPTDLTDRSVITERLRDLVRQLDADVRPESRPVRRVALKIRYPSFVTLTRITTLPAATTDIAEIEQAAITLLDRVDLGRGVRLLGVRVEFDRSD
jgi:DNA polymerase-4